MVRERDRIKDQLCETAGLPLLRVTSDFLRKEGRWNVLTYLVDAFYLAEAFYEAQEQGSIPWDEPFDAGSFIVTDDDGRRMFNNIDAPARDRLWAHYLARRLPAPIPDTFLTLRTTRVPYSPMPSSRWQPTATSSAGSGSATSASPVLDQPSSPVNWQWPSSTRWPQAGWPASRWPVTVARLPPPWPRSSATSMPMASLDRQVEEHSSPEARCRPL